MRDELAVKRDFSRFRLSGKTKTLLWAFAAPLILAVNCFWMRAFLEAEAKLHCASDSGFSNHLRYSKHYSQFVPEAIGRIDCASSNVQDFYAILGFALYLCLCLSIMIPVILYRRRPIQQPKLF